MIFKCMSDSMQVKKDTNLGQCQNDVDSFLIYKVTQTPDSINLVVNSDSSEHTDYMLYKEGKHSISLETLKPGQNQTIEKEDDVDYYLVLAPWSRWECINVDFVNLDSGSSLGLIIGIIVGIAVVIAIVIFVVGMKKGWFKKGDQESKFGMLTEDGEDDGIQTLKEVDD